MCTTFADFQKHLQLFTDTMSKTHMPVQSKINRSTYYLSQLSTTLYVSNNICYLFHIHYHFPAIARTPFKMTISTQHTIFYHPFISYLMLAEHSDADILFIDTSPVQRPQNSSDNPQIRQYQFHRPSRCPLQSQEGRVSE